YGVLELLSLHKGAVVTKEMFAKHLYGGIEEHEFKIINVFVCKLRKKLAQATGGDRYIGTIWGRGYVLRDPMIAHTTTASGASVEDTTRGRHEHDRWAGFSQ